MNRYLKHIPALAACASVVAVVAIALQPAPVAEPTYSLVAFEDDGNIYVLDYDLSERDCRTLERDVRRGYTVCEREG